MEYPSGMPGKWHEFFKNNHPITLELACGKGEYAVGLGRLNREENFIGIDIKGNRMWRGAKNALDEQLNNVAFLRCRIEQVSDYFNPGEVANIWITFPDPQLRISRAKKRLTHPRFLRQYQAFLQPGGAINLKTDSPDLYAFTKTVIDLYDLELLADSNDVYAQPNIEEELKIETHYEKLDIAGSNKIHYLKFRLNRALPVEKDEQLKEQLSEQEIS